MTVPVKTNNGGAGEIMEAVLLKGDLSKLTPEERTKYYLETCKSLGLNPLTKPFDYITLTGKLTLYARRDAADQLRKLHGINIEIVSQEAHDGLLSIHVRAKDRDGRMDEDLGVVEMPENLRGNARANQIMKAVTKAKRRVTLSISGLGLLDETEVEDIPRDNPHVVRPEDIAAVPPTDHPDRIPAGDPDIKPLPKKNARAAFEAMQKEMHAIRSEAELKTWGDASKNRIAVFPLDWQEIMRSLYVEHLTELRAKSPTQKALEESAWLIDLQNGYENCEDMAAFFDVDEKLWKPWLLSVSEEAARKAFEIRKAKLDQMPT